MKVQRSFPLRLNLLRKHYPAGSLLESLESGSIFPTIHIEIIESGISTKTSDNEDNYHPKNQDLSANISKFEEICYLQSAESLLERKCFMVLGFKTPEEGSSDFFLCNWKELTGLGNFLLFLSKKYHVTRVIFLQNVAAVRRDDDTFQFLLLLEIFHQKKDLIYLLDYVQNLRSWRNIGYLSLYGEIGLSNI